MNELNIEWKPNPKQKICLKYLRDKTTKYILYGGSKGCGKTRIGCYWLIDSCISYPGTRWIIGKSHLTEIYKSVLNSFREICKEWKIQDLITYNGQRNTINFKNGSEILLIDLYPNPSDIEYNDLSGIEVTGIFVDELSDIDIRAWEALKSLIRYKLREYNLTPKILAASNPTTGWPFFTFFKPFEEGNLSSDYAFIPALPKDNIMYTGQEYLDLLETMEDGPMKERYLGNWYYDSGDDELFNLGALQQSFHNLPDSNSTMFLTLDVADLGNDRTVFGVWRGYTLKDLIILQSQDQRVVSDKLREIIGKYDIQIHNVIVDANGTGSYIPAFFPGCVRYIAQNKPIKINNDKLKNFKNLKTQLAYKFADLVNNNKISFDIKYNDDLVKELTSYKKKVKNDLHDITSKEDVKKKLRGKSPDIADSLMMRSYFELKKSGYIVEFAESENDFFEL